jgi:hypothetical protein
MSERWINKNSDGPSANKLAIGSIISLLSAKTPLAQIPVDSGIVRPVDRQLDRTRPHVLSRGMTLIV